MSRGRFVGFGEILLRLEERPSRRLVQEEELVARYTGSGANVAVMLSRLGIERCFGIGSAGFTVREKPPAGVNRLTGYFVAGSEARASRTYETAAAACLKLTMPGDFALVTRIERKEHAPTPQEAAVQGSGRDPRARSAA